MSRTGCPAGAFVDNVGGKQLAATVEALREFGRIVRIVTISQYNTPDAPPRRFNYAAVVQKSLHMEGFLVRSYRDIQEELYEFAVPHLQSGRLVLDEAVVDGFEHIVDAFLGMRRGENTCKIIVRDRSHTPSASRHPRAGKHSPSPSRIATWLPTCALSAQCSVCRAGPWIA